MVTTLERGSPGGNTKYMQGNRASQKAPDKPHNEQQTASKEEQVLPTKLEKLAMF